MSDRARRDLAATVAAAETDIAAISREMAAAIRASAEAHALPTPDGPRITPFARLQIMRDVDAALDRLYPSARGNHGALGEIVEGRANEARRLAIGRTVVDMEDRLAGEPDLLATMENDGG